MKVHRAGYLAFALTVCGYAATGVSATQATQAYTLESTKVSVLAADSPEYEPWAAWIKHENSLERALPLNNDQLVEDVLGGPLRRPWAAEVAGQITVKVQLREGSTTQTASPRLDAGPAASLPKTGIAGQQLTVINQTRRAFQKWVYAWVDFSGGGSGWTEVHREATYCGKSKDRESLCTASGF
jgi:hypothetical protein